MKIFLIGYRCTGKTTVGKLLAKKINFNFKDTDLLIEKEAKLNIAQIIKNYGWEKFRLIEQKTLFNLKNFEQSIISTGGGIVTNPDNIKFIKNNGFCIWLDADLKTIIKRLRDDKKTMTLRPSLTDKNLIEETRELLNIRKPLYEKCADRKIDTADKTPEEISNIISDRREINVGQYNR